MRSSPLSLVLLSLVVAAAATPVRPRLYSQPRLSRLVDDSNHSSLSSVPIPATATKGYRFLSALLLASRPVAASIVPMFSKREGEAVSEMLIPSDPGVVSCQPAATQSMVYSGPGLLLDPSVPDSVALDAAPTHIPRQNADDCVAVDENAIDEDVTNPTLRSPTSLTDFLVVLGGSIAGIFALSLCIFLLLNRHIRKFCCAARKRKYIPRKFRFLPSWARGKSGDEQKPLKEKTDTSGLQFSISSDTSFSSAPLPDIPYDEENKSAVVHSSPSPSSVSTLGIAQKTKEPITPVRPPRPPTMDSPALIDSRYFADMDDIHFYKFPNPVICGSISCEVTEGSSMQLVARQSTPSPNMFGYDIPAQYRTLPDANPTVPETPATSVEGEKSDEEPLYAPTPAPPPKPV